ncbi:MAG: tetratricopeptide repeat protein [Deltaproteobacteria bacterium]|nr:tetratricopeptide repeat protein [Deltaproteobacteria bacterium]
MSRPGLVLLCAFALVHSLFGCGGCTARAKEYGATRETRWQLSPQAQISYHYLLLDLGMRGNNEEHVLHALEKLAVLAPNVQLFLDSAVWLVARKSARALPILEKALAAYPGDTNLNLLMAEALLEYGHAEKAVSHMRSFAAKYPEVTDAKTELALLLVKLKHFEEAHALFAALPQKERSYLVEYYHARALNGLGRQDDALRHFTAAVQKSPKLIEAWAELALLHEKRKDHKNARQAYEELLRLSEANQDLLLRLVTLSSNLGEAERALEYVRKGPDSPAFLFTAIGIFLENKQWQAAETLLDEMRARPNPPEELYLYLAGIALDARNSPEDALRWVERISPDSQAHTRAIPFKIQLLGALGKKDEALAFLKQEREKTPEDQKLFQLEVRQLAFMDRLDAALDLADAGMRAWPANLDIAFLHASLLDERGDKNAAFAAMEKISRADPGHYQSLNYLGYTLADENRELPRALELLTRAVELAPDLAYILDSLAWAQYRLGSFDAAWESIRKVVNMDSAEDPTIWEHYGDIATALGKAEEARKGYARALELNPKNADSIRARLSKI